MDLLQQKASHTKVQHNKIQCMNKHDTASGHRMRQGAVPPQRRKRRDQMVNVGVGM